MLERIFHFADTTPDAIAIYDHDDELSYRAFAEAIGSARTGFADQQVTGDGVAALVAEAHSDYWIHAFALNTLGLTTIAVREAHELAEFDLPELKFVVSSTRSPFLETLQAERGVRLVSPPSLRDPPSRPTAQEMANKTHILYSSGTTGRKKMLLRTVETVEVGGLRTDQTMVYHVFDYGPWTLAGFGIPRNVWSSGGAILIHQRAGAAAALGDPRATHASVIPLSLNEILAAPEGAFPFNERLQFAIGGGPVSWSQVKEIKRRLTANVINMFASTEVGMIARTRLERSGDERWHQPVPGQHVEVVNDQRQVVPLGTIGQLRVAYGDRIASYYHDPETTATFFADGFFYPGDLAVMREDGRFSLLGRVTDVVNLHGSKFDPQPLEAAIEETCGLGPCCVVSAPDATGTEKLFVVVEHPSFMEASNVDCIVRELTNFFGVNWSGAIHLIHKFPRTETGKIIRRELQPMIARMAEQRQIEPVNLPPDS